MPRAIWRGTISFGLVNVPAGLMGATVDKDVHFHQVDEKTGARIRQKRVSERTGREVDDGRIANGYERSSGKWVVLTDEELKAADPERSHTIDIEAFVDLDDIDPLQYDRAYWVVPEDQEGAKKAYALLRTAMEKSGRGGDRALRPAHQGAPRRPAAAPERPGAADHALRRRAGEGVVGAGSAGADLGGEEGAGDGQRPHRLPGHRLGPGRLPRRHRARVKKLIDRKAEGEEIMVAEPPERAEVIDLMKALEESVAAARSGKKQPRKKSA